MSRLVSRVLFLLELLVDHEPPPQPTSGHRLSHRGREGVRGQVHPHRLNYFPPLQISATD